MPTRWSRMMLIAFPLIGTACADDISGFTGTGISGTGGSGSSSAGTMSTTSMGPNTVTDSMGMGGGSSDTGQVDTTSAMTNGSSTSVADTTVGDSGTGSSTSAVTNASLSGSSSGDPPPDDGDCCFGHGSPGCEVAAIETCVCAIDPFCCSVDWDGVCAGMAIDNCGANCPMGGSSSGDSGSSDGGSDSGSTGDAPDSDCCTESVMGLPGCTDPVCEADVCAMDAFCCDTGWDMMCVESAQMVCPALCDGMGSGSTGDPPPDSDCCTESMMGLPGCTDAGCEADVCMIDAFCCNNEWDVGCANQAAVTCPGLCGGMGSDSSGGMGTGSTGDPPPDSDCCAESMMGLPGCTDAMCEADVCAVDPFCCDMGWDFMCADQAAILCPGLCGVFDCCMANGTPGCSDPGCEIAVCGADAYCCSVEWDMLCANLANGGLCPGVCP